MEPEKGRDDHREPETNEQGRGAPELTGISIRKFEMGQIVQTANSMGKLHPEDVFSAVSRHSQGDWGDCCAEDRAENELALKEGFRLFSVYFDESGTKFWIITEADRSSTCILLPEDY